MSLDEDTRQRIASIIGSDRVVLFMKGHRHVPQCGFSATVVQILDSMVPEYTTVDVLSDPAVREGIKEFSSWPTVPQLYVNGEFVGGCDIVREMYSAGELQARAAEERSAGNERRSAAQRGASIPYRRSAFVPSTLRRDSAGTSESSSSVCFTAPGNGASMCG